MGHPTTSRKTERVGNVETLPEGPRATSNPTPLFTYISHRRTQQRALRVLRCLHQSYSSGGLPKNHGRRWKLPHQVHPWQS
ncbi:hypothetical protein FKM82_003537 [Ascaphus truei]